MRRPRTKETKEWILGLPINDRHLVYIWFLNLLQTLVDLIGDDTSGVHANVTVNPGKAFGVQN